MKLRCMLCVLCTLGALGAGCPAIAATPPDAGAPLQLPPAPAVQLAQRLGDTLPLDTPLQDEAGRAVRLGTLFSGQRAVIVVPGYHRCTVLCGLVMQGVLEALAQSGLPPDAWRIVGFSFDPADTPASARARQADYLGYARFVSGGAASAPDLHLLTASRAAAQQLTQAMGYAVQPGAPNTAGGIAHSAGFVVATPNGRIARYFPGVRFDAPALRTAVVDANGGRIGSLSERLTLLCGHYDPVSGRYSVTVMTWLRVLGCAGVLALVAWLWRHRRARALPGSASNPPSTSDPSSP